MLAAQGQRWTWTGPRTELDRKEALGRLTPLGMTPKERSSTLRELR